MKQDVQKIVSVMAADFHGPAGPIPFERLLRRHHRLLADLRERGLTWEQVSRLLAGNGVKRRNGLAFPASHLRGVFGRHRSRLSESVSRKRSIGSAAVTNVGLSSQEGFDTGRQNADSRGSCSGPVNCQALANPRDRTGELRSGDGAAIGGSMVDSRAQALAVMKQSVRARRVAE
jgi:hypothetical protein